MKSWVTASAPRWEFETFLSDYEQAAFGATVDVFPGTGEEGYFFHLCKKLNFQVKELGLLPKYTVDDPFKLRVKKFAALAFVPVADVVACFESLATTFLTELTLLAYFEGTWIERKLLESLEAQLNISLSTIFKIIHLQDK